MSNSQNLNKDDKVALQDSNTPENFSTNHSQSIEAIGYEIPEAAKTNTDQEWGLPDENDLHANLDSPKPLSPKNLVVPAISINDNPHQNAHSFDFSGQPFNRSDFPRQVAYDPTTNENKNSKELEIQSPENSNGDGANASGKSTTGLIIFLLIFSIFLGFSFYLFKKFNITNEEENEL